MWILERLFSMGFLVLLACTWPLWIPQSVFPQVPLIAIGGQIASSVEWGLLVLLLASLCVMVFVDRPTVRRSASLLAGISTLALVGIDQHRLQPWVWQFMILSVVLAAADVRFALAAWRWLVIGIYAWSAWSKMDQGFCVQHGPFLLNGFCQSIGLVNGTRFWPDDLRYGVAAAIPVVEFLVAVGLSWRLTRPFAIFGAALMHVGLLLALGPFGHGHRPGVLIWNLFFLVQNWLLFRSDRGHHEPNSAMNTEEGRDCAESSNQQVSMGPVLARPDSRSQVTVGENSITVAHIGNWFAGFIVLAAMVWPLFESFGLCDHWPAWAVYAARPERITVFLDEADLPKLPENMKQYLGPQLAFDNWYPLRLDRWSLDAVYAPIYPQDRFQVGVALGLARDLNLNQIRIDIEGPANRWTGKRTIQQYVGREAIGKLADSYRLGARPR